MTRGVLSLSLLVGLLFIALLLREFTPSWRVGKELEDHKDKLTELEGGVAGNRHTGATNQEGVTLNREAIARNSDAIKGNRRDIDAAKEDMTKLAQDADESVSGLKKLYEKTVMDSGRLAQEVKQLKDTTNVLESRLRALEEKLDVSAPAPEVVQ